MCTIRLRLIGQNRPIFRPTLDLFLDRITNARIVFIYIMYYISRLMLVLGEICGFLWAATSIHEFCIKHDEFCITYDELCIKNDEFCSVCDEFCTKNDEFCI